MERVKRVRIIGSEYGSKFIDKTGEVLGTIPPDSESPNRIMVKLQDGPVINFRPEDLRIVKSKKQTAEIQSQLIPDNL